jgi:hypothetical protein
METTIQKITRSLKLIHALRGFFSANNFSIPAVGRQMDMLLCIHFVVQRQL